MNRVTESDPSFFVRRHLRLGWWWLLVFLSLGLGLEVLHGFKAAFYLDVSNQTRRLLWTLAHAHGTLLALVNIAFAAAMPLLPLMRPNHRKAASVCLRISSVLLPIGFFLGGLFVHSGDPGLGILLVPLGAGFLMVAVFRTARSAGGK